MTTSRKIDVLETTKLTQRTEPVGGPKLDAQSPSPHKTQRKSNGKKTLSLFVQRGKRGPSPKTRPDLLWFRNQLVMLSENWWPEFQLVISIPASPPRVRRLLLAIQAQHPGEAIAHLLVNEESLIAAINSGRIRNDPHQLANAMAGVPDVSFWTSLRHCQNNPCDSAIGLRALRAYIQRKHNRLWYRLRDGAINDVDEIRLIFTEYDLRDKNLTAFKKNPRRLQEAWRAGKPDLERLNLK